MINRLSVAVAALAVAAAMASVQAQDFNTALDQPYLSFVTTGDATWVVDESEAGPTGNASSARSGSIGNSQYSSLWAGVEGPTTVRFYWKVSCEETFDGLRLYVDGSPTAGITGEVDWVQYNLPIAAGAHTIEWRYTKDSANSAGSDAGWVDNVRVDGLTATPTPTPVPTSTPTATPTATATPTMPPSMEFTSEQASVVDPHATDVYWVLAYNYDSSATDWDGPFLPSQSSYEISTYDVAADAWEGVFLYDAGSAEYTEAQYIYRTNLHSDWAYPTSTAVPEWNSTSLIGEPKASLRFSASSALCGVDVPTGDAGFVLFYDYGRATADWQDVTTPDVYSLRFTPALPGQWTGIYLYTTTYGQYDEDVTYVISDQFTATAKANKEEEK